LTALNSWDFLKKESRIFYEFLIGMLHWNYFVSMQSFWKAHWLLKIL